MVDITNEEIIELINWMDYEHTLFMDEQHFEERKVSDRIFDKKLMGILKKLGCETVEDFYNLKKK